MNHLIKWVQSITGISAVTQEGLFSAGIAIALKDLIVNIAGWTFIVWRRPLGVDDRIEIGEYARDFLISGYYSLPYWK